MSHNICDWSEPESTQTAVPRPWTGIVVAAVGGTVTHKRLIKTEAPTRSEAITKLRAQTPIGWQLVAAFFGDHSDVILRVV